MSRHGDFGLFGKPGLFGLLECPKRGYRWRESGGTRQEQVVDARYQNCVPMVRFRIAAKNGHHPTIGRPAPRAKFFQPVRTSRHAFPSCLLRAFQANLPALGSAHERSSTRRARSEA